VADFPAVPEYRSDLGRGYWYLGGLLDSVRRRPEAEKAYRSALAIQNRLVAEFPSVPEYRQQLALSHLGLGETLRYLGRPQEHRQALQEAAAILEKLVAECPTVPEYRNYLAGVYYWLANLLPSPEAEQSLGKALILQEKLAADFPGQTDYRYDLFRSLATQGSLFLRAERTTEAELAFRRAVEIGEKLVAESPTVHYYRSRLASSYRGLADLLGHTGKFSEAATTYEHSINIYERLLVEVPDVHDAGEQMVASYLGLARTFSKTGRPEAAKDTYEKLLRLRPKNHIALNKISWFLATAPDPKARDGKRAVELAKEAVEFDPKDGNYWSTLGVAQYRVGEWKNGIDALTKSDELRKGEMFSFNAFFLAMAHWQLGEKEEARKSYDQAVAWMEKNQPEDDELRRFREEAATLLNVENPSKTIPMSK
jgi:tetratricopeptide (TPR) repeat protein